MRYQQTAEAVYEDMADYGVQVIHDIFGIPHEQETAYKLSQRFSERVIGEKADKGDKATVREALVLLGEGGVGVSEREYLQEDLLGGAKVIRDYLINEVDLALLVRLGVQEGALDENAVLNKMLIETVLTIQESNSIKAALAKLSLIEKKKKANSLFDSLFRR